jgi:hypothetical protein
MTNLKELLERAFDVEGSAIKHGWVIDSNGEQEQCEWTYLRCKEAMKHQHAQTQWAFEALEIAVEALESADKFFMDNGDYRGTVPHMRVAIPLNKIAALVPGGES